MTSPILPINLSALSSVHFSDNLASFIQHLTLIAPLLDALPNVVFFIKDIEARYIFVNHTLLTRLGFKHKHQLLGLTSEGVFFGLQGGEYTLQDKKVLEGKTITDKLELHTYPSGRLGWCLTHKMPIYDKTGQIIAMAGVSIDADKDSRLHLRHHERLGRVVDYIQQHLDTKLTVAELAEYAEVSISQLERMFKSVLNLSPSQMIQKMRLEVAINLLTHSNTPVTQIAGQCGYSDHSAFSRQFRQLTGLSPSELRRMNT